MELNRIYLDNAATTPVDQRVLDTMLPYFSEHYGNPSSIHTFGQEAESAMENARETVAKILNCHSREIVFTSCGSESDNLALRGAAFAARQSRNANHILITPVEHHAVSRTAEELAQRHGFVLEYIPVDEYGMVQVAEFRKRLRADTALVSVIYANNEIGTINPISLIGELCHEKGIPFHTDAVQAAAYLPVDVTQLNVDLMAIGAHKFYGPKGVGALFIRDGTPIIPIQTGGGQEYGIRAGTSNTPYIVGLAEALRLANEEREQRINHVQPLRDQIITNTLTQIPDSQLTGHPQLRMPNHASFVFKGVDGNALLMMLDVEGFACSSGSACKTGSPEPSEVLISLGYTQEWALGSLRVTLGKQTKPEEVEVFNQQLPTAIQRIRQLMG